MLKLTCNDAWHTLGTVVHYGIARKLMPEIAPGGNHIAIASEQVIQNYLVMTNHVDFQGYLQCTKKSYAFGYRIVGPKTEDEKKNTPKEERDGAKYAAEEDNLLLNEEEQKGDVLPGQKEKLREKHVLQAPYPDQVKFHEGFFFENYSTYF